MSAFDPSPCDPAPELPPAADADPSWGELESLRRAMPIQRLLGSGMRYDDALNLHEFSVAGVNWQRAGEWLGNRNLRLAHASPTDAGKRSYFRFGSACFRAAQAAIPRDTREKERLFAAMVDAFGHAANLDNPRTEKREIPWRDGAICGWLLRPEDVERPPVVIILGGFDGWREEYWPGAEQLLRRGIAAFLVDGPGQGESRIRYKIYLDENFHQAFSRVADALMEEPTLGDRLGIWGNSLGGFLAARVAAADPRFSALCVNGGTVRPIELPERFPRFWEKVEAMVGGSREQAGAILRSFDLSAHFDQIKCPLLQIHSEPDQVFLLNNAEQIYQGSLSEDKEIRIWADGDHCIYNHSEEKSIYISDWFSTKLKASN